MKLLLPLFALWMVLMIVLFASYGIQNVIENNRGVALSHAGQTLSAIRHFEGIVVNAPQSIEAQFNLASSWLNEGEYEKARDMLVYLLKQDQLGNLVGSIHYNLGIAEFRLQNYQGAVESFRNVLLSQPSNNDARYNYELALHLLTFNTSTPVPTTTGDTDNPNPTQLDTPTPQDSRGSEGKPTPTPPTNSPDNASIATPNQGGQGANEPEQPKMTYLPSDNLSPAQAESLLDDAYEQQKVLSDDSIVFGTPSGEWLNDW